jgi:hypothetical protein
LVLFQFHGIATIRSTQKKLGFFRQTIPANTEKVQPVIQNFKLGLQSDLFFHFIQAFQVRVDDFVAPDADDVWMGVGLVPVVPVASIRESQLENFPDRLDQHDIPVHGGEAHGRKIFDELGVDVLDGGMAFAFGQNGHDGHPLGCDLVAIVPQFLNDAMASIVGVRHGSSFFIN